MHIQDLAGSDVDVILGFNNDNRLDEKVQVILVITGLGAQTLEDIIPGSEQKISEKVVDPLEEFMFDVPEPTPDLDNDQEDKESETVPFTSSPKNNLAVQSDLDIPAFLRRRTRYQTSTQG